MFQERTMGWRGRSGGAAWTVAFVLPVSLRHFVAALPVAAALVLAGSANGQCVPSIIGGTAALLHRLTGVSDMAIGLPVARQGVEGMYGLVGHGVQLLPVRLGVEPDDSFQALISQSKSATLDAQEHFDFTFGNLIRELGLSGDPSRVPLVPVIFNIDQPFGELKLGGSVATLRSVPR